MSIPQTQRKKLYNMLRYGDISRIAGVCGVSRMTVYNWFRGSSNSPRVESAIIQWVYMLKERELEIRSRLEDLLK